MTNQTKVWTVERHNSQLVAESVGIKQFLRLPLTVTNRVDQGDVVTVTLHEAGFGNHHLTVSAQDSASLAVLDALPRGASPAPALRTAADVQRAQRVLTPVSGTVSCDGDVITVTVEGDTHYYLVGHDARPKVHSAGLTADGHFEVMLTLPGAAGPLRLQVPADDVEDTRRGVLFLQDESTPPGSQSRRHWEYKIVKNMLAGSLEAELNELGRHGWEVVSITGIDGAFTLTGNKIFCVLKREVRQRP